MPVERFTRAIRGRGSVQRQSSDDSPFYDGIVYAEGIGDAAIEAYLSSPECSMRTSGMRGARRNEKKSATSVQLSFEFSLQQAAGCQRQKRAENQDSGRKPLQRYHVASFFLWSAKSNAVFRS